ncbi:MAG: DUF87 domain-containing protein [Candidatus Promineifilaceae bacterium]
MDTKGQFYLGRVVEAATGQSTGAPLLYDPDNLTTHAVVVGMTGSGKTGLCLDLLEEAALNRIPAIMIDPKGDITNALLHFPDLLPADFQPWINPDLARREGKSVAQAAADTAALWRKGLADWDMTPERIARLRDGVQFAVYTPGSDAGIPVSILSSLAAPNLPWESHKEALREQIAGTVTALLGLVGFKDIDPIRSREHILLTNIFEHAWSQGKDLTLPELILQTQNPPFAKLGVFDISLFFPDKDRFRLAMDLNSILAAPAFQSWITGEPLNVSQLLYDPQGQPRHAIFYIAHLTDQERMFFVTLLFSAIESWMRAQQGTTALRALVYFDEIFGYLPPIGNPPAKEPMLRLLKQARAFGLGLVLATQNPVDVDYKGLSNAGSWFIGKLGTEQDKERLLDGLASLSGDALDRREYDHLISALGKRVFLLRNVHDPHPTLFQTRWAMNYLAGPLTRQQIPALNALAGAAPPVTAAPATAAPAALPRAIPAHPQSAAAVLSAVGSETRPPVPARIAEYFFPNDLSFSQAVQTSRQTGATFAQPVGLLYRPALLAHASVRFTNRKYNLDTDVLQTALVTELDARLRPDWSAYLLPAFAPSTLDRSPLPQARFAPLEPPLTNASDINALQSDFLDWVYRTTTLTLQANEALKVYAGPDVSTAEFARRCTTAAAAAQQIELDKVEAAFERQLDALEEKLRREKRELEEDEADYAARKREEAGKHLETLLGFIGGRRKSVSSSLSKRRLTEKAKMEVKESEEAIVALEKELDDLEAECDRALADVRRKWEGIAAEVSQITVQPFKKDVVISHFGVAWLPYYVVEGVEMPASRHLAPARV